MSAHPLTAVYANTVPSSKPCVLLDSEDRVIVVLAGQPSSEADPTWSPSVVKAAGDAMQDACSSNNFSEEQSNHRRGQYPAVSVGISFGGGQQLPGNLVITSLAHKAMVARLLSNTAIIRLATFASGEFFINTVMLSALMQNLCSGICYVVTQTLPTLSGDHGRAAQKQPQSSEELSKEHLLSVNF